MHSCVQAASTRESILSPRLSGATPFFVQVDEAKLGAGMLEEALRELGGKGLRFDWAGWNRLVVRTPSRSTGYPAFVAGLSCGILASLMKLGVEDGVLLSGVLRLKDDDSGRGGEPDASWGPRSAHMASFTRVPPAVVLEVAYRQPLEAARVSCPRCEGFFAPMECSLSSSRRLIVPSWAPTSRSASACSPSTKRVRSGGSEAQTSCSTTTRPPPSPPLRWKFHLPLAPLSTTPSSTSNRLSSTRPDL